MELMYTNVLSNGELKDNVNKYQIHMTNNIINKFTKQFCNEFENFIVSFKRYKVPNVGGNEYKNL
jgi:hypothetical protein